MGYFLYRVQLLLLNDLIQVSNHMVKLPINFTIGLRLPTIELLVIFIKNVWNSNFAWGYFKKISHLLIPHNDKTILLRRWQILILSEELFSSLRACFRIPQTESVKLRYFSPRLSITHWRNVRSNNILVPFNKLEQLLGFLDRIHHMRRIQKVINMMKNIPILRKGLFYINLPTVQQLITQVQFYPLLAWVFTWARIWYVLHLNWYSP